MNHPVSRAKRGLCWGTIPQASAVELIRAAGEVGFDAVTLSQVAHADVLDDGGRAVRSLCAANGVVVESVEPIIGPLPGLPAPGDVPADLAVFLTTTAERAVHIAEAVEARSVNIAHFLGLPVPLEAMIEAIAPVVDQAGRRDLSVTIEFIPGTGIPDLATAARIIEAIHAPELRILLDVWHLARSGGSIADVNSLPPQSIGGMQISDRAEPAAGASYAPMGSRLMPGEGELPLAGLLMATLTNSPDVTVCAEVFNTDHARQPIPVVAERAATAMRALGFH